MKGNNITSLILDIEIKMNIGVHVMFVSDERNIWRGRRDNKYFLLCRNAITKSSYD